MEPKSQCATYHLFGANPPGRRRGPHWRPDAESFPPVRWTKMHSCFKYIMWRSLGELPGSESLLMPEPQVLRIAWGSLSAPERVSKP